MDNRRIGFFDSGIGGLTSVSYLFKDLPKERVLFFGDTARTPYGSKSEHVIKRFACEIGAFMRESNVKMMVAACNTISATALDELRDAYGELPVIGVIEPACDQIAKECASDEHIGIIATKATISANAYLDGIKTKNNSITHIYQKACPAFVPLIEEGIIRNEIMDETVRYYLDTFITQNRIDTLVLGCTHYQLIRENIERLYPGIKMVSSSEEVVRRIGEVLNDRDMYADGKGEESIFYASDLSDNFLNMIDLLLGDKKEELNIKFKSMDM